MAIKPCNVNMNLREMAWLEKEKKYNIKLLKIIRKRLIYMLINNHSLISFFSIFSPYDCGLAITTPNPQMLLYFVCI